MALAQTKLDKSDDSQATIVFFKETLPPLIGLKIEYPWIIHFSLILYSN